MRSENVEDRLSILPEDIISHILSLMPTRFAVRTCVLSKRWRYSWMFVTNFDIDDNHVPYVFNRFLSPDMEYLRSYIGDDEEIHSCLESDDSESDKWIKFVDTVLERCKAPQLKSFRLHIYNTPVSDSLLWEWIDKAVMLNVHEVDIKLTYHELPVNLLTCKTLTKLRIHHNYYVWEDWRVNLPCLKTLDVVVFDNPFVSAFKLINGSPILEYLFLNVQSCEVGKDFVFNIPTLKQLRLTLTCSERASFSNRVVLNVPNLESLFVGGDLCSLFVMENVSSLVEASVSFYNITFDHRWFELVKGLSQVKSLSIRNIDFSPSQNLLISRSSSWPIFLNMKHLELKGSYDFALLPQFLESSPQLKHLCIEKFDNLLLKKQRPVEFSWIGVIEPDWIELKLVPACMLKSLATIKFLKCKKQKWDMEFLKYMLGNAQVLKNVTVVPENLCVEEETRFCAELLMLPKGSPHCEIQFLGSCSSSTGIN